MVYKFLFLLVPAILICSCGGIFPPKWAKSVTDGKQAIAKEYHLSKKKFVFSNLIDTNSVYIAENNYLLTNRKGDIVDPERKYYDFLRLSGNGICFKRSMMLDKPTDFDFNNLDGGQFCYYSITSDIIQMERYNHDHKIFEFWYGKIQTNGDILFFKAKGRPWGTYTQKLNLLFRKNPAKITTKIIFPK
jgi:hypothetical protein